MVLFERTRPVPGEEDAQLAKIFYLTFDGAVNPPNTLRILEQLEKLDVRATFFVEGHRIAGHERILRDMASAGHHIGNHSFHHPEFDKIPLEDCMEEIRSTDEALYAALGFRTRLVRPPCGILPEDRRRLLEQAGYWINLWSISVKDWLGPDAETVAERTLSLSSGNEVTAVFHDHLDTTADTVALVIPRLRDKGYELMPIPY